MTETHRRCSRARQVRPLSSCGPRRRQSERHNGGNPDVGQSQNLAALGLRRSLAPARSVRPSRATLNVKPAAQLPAAPRPDALRR
jgi:hypothetical protein